MTELFLNFQLKMGGTAGGAVTVLTPTLTASIPRSVKIGKTAWVIAENYNHRKMKMYTCRVHGFLKKKKTMLNNDLDIKTRSCY